MCLPPSVLMSPSRILGWRTWKQGHPTALRWRLHLSGDLVPLRETLSSFPPLQKWQKACCLGKGTGCNYTLLIAEDLITENLGQKHTEQGAHLAKRTSLRNPDWAGLSPWENSFWWNGRKTEVMIIKYYQTGTGTGPGLAEPTISKQWKPSLKFKSFFPLFQNNQGKRSSQYRAKGRKREATAAKNQKMCGPPRQAHPASLHAQSKRSQARVS